MDMSSLSNGPIPISGTLGTFSYPKTTVTPLFEIPEKRSSVELVQVEVEGQEPFLKLTLRGFDGVHTGQRLEDLLDELTIIVLAHAEATGSDMSDLDEMLLDDDFLDALVQGDEDNLEGLFFGTFGDEEDTDPFGGCQCEECALERTALNEDLR